MVWMLDTNESEIWLFGEDWINKDKKPPALNERGERLSMWMKDGGKISAKDMQGRVETYRNILSDDPKYLKAIIAKMQEDLELMAEVMDINDMVYKEFHAQEHYRQVIRNGLAHHVQKFRDFCHQDLTGVHSPKTPSEQYQHGRSTGRYETFAMCAQYVQDVIDQAAMAVAKDKQKEMEEEANES